jgi:hypothetical protein
MSVYDGKYRKKMNIMHSKLIIAEKWLSLNQVIEFGCICTMKGFLNVEDLS